MVSIRLKVTVPKEKFTDKRWVEEVVSTMRRKTGPELRFEFQRTVNTWDKKPFFAIHQEVGSQRISTSVHTFNDIYALVNAGSPSHVIYPKWTRTGGIGRGFLRFRSGYASKTKAGSTRSFVGGPFGDFVSARVVHHPGFEARRFDQLIADDYLPTFERDMQEAFKRAAK